MLILLCAFLLAADTLPDQKALTTMAARFAPVKIDADVSKLPAEERAALVEIVAAAKIMDSLFLRQVWGQNTATLLDLAADATPLGKARLDYFLINKGPWSRLDHNAAFLPNVPKKPDGGAFYPSDAPKPLLEAFFKGLNDKDRAQATGFFTTIRRQANGALSVVPYNLEYQDELEVAGAHLDAAAKLTKQPTLAAFLSKRADAFRTNDYYASDVAWMELDASIEPTIGPYEVYEDELFNFKAAFEAFITLRDDQETAKLQKFGAELQGIEDALPIDEKLKNKKLAALSPIRVVNVVYTSGDANKAVQTAAFNLPNDERVIKEKGSKRVMLKNVQEAKFKMVLLPISKRALAAADQKNVAFDAFFTHILMHELMHGLGPHNIKAAGKDSTVRQELKETYSAIEEAKADVSGLFALGLLVDKGVIDKSMAATMYTTFLASSFRTLGFGIAEAHGKGMALQLNYLLDFGAFLIRKDGTFAVEPTKIADGVKALTRDLMTLQAEGNYQKARSLIDTLAVIRPEVQKMLDKMRGIPTDIRPIFTAP
ncbi:MAG: hypothetical protein IT381_31195 [Deltaproteobacteria bacterium]|nr:hypothetical protein [Deltaproteobacteria bacterium]